MMPRADGRYVHGKLKCVRPAVLGPLTGLFLTLVILIQPSLAQTQGDPLGSIRSELSELSKSVDTLSGSYLSQALRERDNRFAARMNEGQFFYYAKAYDRAAIVFLDLVENPKYRVKAGYRDAVFFLAQSFYKLRNFKGSIRFYQLLVDIGSTGQKQNALSRLLELSLQTNDKALGRKAALAAEKFAQNSADAELLYSLAKFRYRSGALRASERLFARVQKGATTYMKAQYFRGVVLIRLKKLEPANQAFREAYETSVDAVDGSDEKRIQNQALLAMARIAYEQSEFALAIDLYNRVPRNSSAFDHAMYELVWIAIKAKDYDKALRKLELLLISQPDILLGPDARLLQAKLKLMMKAYDAAEGAFQVITDSFGGIQRDMDAVKRKHKNLARHFDKVIGDRIADFDIRSVLPDKAAKVAGDALTQGKDMQLVADVAAQRRDMDESRRAIEVLNRALASETRVEMFPKVHMGILRGIELRSQLTDVCARVNEIVGQSMANQPADYRALRRNRMRGQARLGLVPRSVVKIKERDAQVDAQMSQIDQAAHRLRVDLIGIEAQLVAIKKYLRDTEQKPSYQTARDVLKRELAQAKEVKAQIEELSLQIQEERMGVGVNDAASQSDDKLFEQYHSAVSKESRWLVQRGQSLGRDIRTEVNRLERLIAGFTRQAERVVDQRIADYKQMVKQEQLKVNQYTGQLGGHEASTRALGGVIAARSFVAVLDRIASIVLNADVGLVDVAWKRKDDKSKEISRVYEQQSGEEQRLKGLFDEAKANGE